MASGISNIGSGIDFGAIVDATIAVRSAPISQLANKQSTLKSRADALRQLNAQLITFSNSVNSLTDRTLGNGRSVNSTSPDVVLATVSDTANVGTVNVEVLNLASNLSQASRSFSSVQSPILANGASSATFELRKGGATTGKSITIDSTNNTLTGLRDAINAAGTGVTATIVDVSGNGTDNQLVLTSSESGSGGRIELAETTNTETLTSLNIRNLNTPNGSFSDLDAKIKIGGLTISRSSNTISDAVNGVTLNLKNVGTTKITVTNETASLKSKIAAFVDAFNGVQDFINNQYKTDANGKPTGTIASDTTLRSVQQELRNAVNQISKNNGGALNNLTQIGIGRDSNGKLTLDQTVLNDKLSNNLSDVKALFAGVTDNNKGFAKILGDAGKTLSDSVQTAITGFDNSVKNLSKSIADQQDRLIALRASLTKHFSVVDAAIGQINGQNTALSNVLASLSPSSSK